ncbi:uncharacterized protein EV422DRAFT_539937 [Fimicolochytrium jonesii]|uniref:uncharacterized protein n=1 Tax=Fimicolochytrium jonesii TaxID=1396493 RepID=UPI0022FF093B|nr:uncharacterized protein EV422DRAFT_539937 [Fimicolochytrium jonesii]KAI8817792.1 hypothetical protein EV422DRAFT_539937 [Fimicolochytrium jonesii]
MFSGSAVVQSLLVWATILAVAIAAPLSCQDGGDCLPMPPNGISIFPDRDFLTVEAYWAQQGKIAEVRVSRMVSRSGLAADAVLTVVASVKAVVSGGANAFDINHPGGYCWGAGTDIKVTPDIVGGDIIDLYFDNIKEASVRTLDAKITSVVYDGSKILTLKGYVDPFNKDKCKDCYEVRIVNPDLRPFVTKRDIRAPQPTTHDGYTSTLVINPDNNQFVATFTFDDVEAAQIAYRGGGARVMGWLDVTPDALPRGLTIHELGETGGPGMGGCPPGPQEFAPPASKYWTTVETTGETPAIKNVVTVSWKEPTMPAGLNPLAGYDVLVLQPKASKAVRSDIVGAYVPAPASQTQITVVGPNIIDATSVQIRAVVEHGPTDNPTTRTSDLFTLRGPLKLAAEPATGQTAQFVKLTSSNAGIIKYTLNTPIYETESPKPIFSASAKVYTGPIELAQSAPAIAPGGRVELNVAYAFSDSDEFTKAQFIYTLAAPVPVPTGLKVVGGAAIVTISWNKDANAKSYLIQEYEGSTGPTIGDPFETLSTETTAAQVTVFGRFGKRDYTYGREGVVADLGHGLRRRRQAHCVSLVFR